MRQKHGWISLISVKYMRCQRSGETMISDMVLSTKISGTQPTIKMCVHATPFCQNIGLKIASSVYIWDHLSMGLLNFQLGTSFSPIDTVLVSRLCFANYCMITKHTFSCNWAVLDFCSNFNFFTFTIGFNGEDNCCQLHKIKKSIIKDMLLKGILSTQFWQVYYK